MNKALLKTWILAAAAGAVVGLFIRPLIISDDFVYDHYELQAYCYHRGMQPAFTPQDMWFLHHRVDDAYEAAPELASAYYSGSMCCSRSLGDNYSFIQCYGGDELYVS